MHLRTELDGVKRQLNIAYERARAVGYRPGSPAMRELEAAEQAYRRVRDRYTLLADHVYESPSLRSIDLRDSATSRAPSPS